MSGAAVPTGVILANAGTAIPYLGETYALLAALNWSFALVLFKFSGSTVSPLSLNLFKNVVAIVLFALLLVIFGVDMSFFAAENAPDLCVSVISGIIGIAIADTLFFYSLNIVGVGVASILECAYTPCVVLFAWWMLSEQVEGHHLLGGALVLLAVLLVSRHRPPGALTRGQLAVGTVLGVAAVGMMAFGIVLVKPILEDGPLIEITLLRLVGGTAMLAALLGGSRHRRLWYNVFRPSPVWRTAIPAAVMGSFLAMVFWVGGYKYTQAAVAAILNQTSTIMALIFARLILKESFTRMKAVAAAMALVGILIVVLGG